MINKLIEIALTILTDFGPYAILVLVTGHMYYEWRFKRMTNKLATTKQHMTEIGLASLDNVIGIRREADEVIAEAKKISDIPTWDVISQILDFMLVNTNLIHEMSLQARNMQHIDKKLLEFIGTLAAGLEVVKCEGKADAYNLRLLNSDLKKVQQKLEKIGFTLLPEEGSNVTKDESYFADLIPFKSKLTVVDLRD